MGELGGTVKYLYWSTRRTDRFLQDNDIELQQVSDTAATPSAPFLPVLSRTTTRTGNTRARMASVIESALGKTAVTDFNSPGPIRYAKGVSSVTFGEFITWGNSEKLTRKPAVMFTACDYDANDTRSVAVCLFGSMDNFPDYIQSAGPGFQDGWVSSSAPYVFEFIRSRGAILHEDFTKEEIAVEALRIADGQGLSDTAAVDRDLGVVDAGHQVMAA
jgi:hypothetical protein